MVLIVAITQLICFGHKNDPQTCNTYNGVDNRGFHGFIKCNNSENCLQIPTFYPVNRKYHPLRATDATYQMPFPPTNPSPRNMLLIQQPDQKKDEARNKCFEAPHYSNICQITLEPSLWKIVPAIQWIMVNTQNPTLFHMRQDLSTVCKMDVWYLIQKYWLCICLSSTLKVSLISSAGDSP